MTSTVTTANGMVIFTQIFPQDSPEAQALKQPTAEATEPSPPKLSEPLQKFIKGEPRALGTVQIMVGIVSIIFGIALAFGEVTLPIYTGVPFWTSVLFIASGSVAVATDRKPSTCLVQAALGLNVISSVAAGIGIIMYCIDIANDPEYYVPRCKEEPTRDPYDSYSYYYSNCNYQRQRLIYSVVCIKVLLLLFALLEFCIAISISAFGCKAISCDSQMPRIIIQSVQSRDSIRDPILPPYEKLDSGLPPYKEVVSI